MIGDNEDSICHLNAPVKFQSITCERLLTMVFCSYRISLQDNDKPVMGSNSFNRTVLLRRGRISYFRGLLI